MAMKEFCVLFILFLPLVFASYEKKQIEISRIDKLENMVIELKEQNNDQNKKIRALQEKLLEMENLLDQKCSQPVLGDTDKLNDANRADENEIIDDKTVQNTVKTIGNDNDEKRKIAHDSRRGKRFLSNLSYDDIMGSSDGKERRLWKRDTGRNTSDVVAFHAVMRQNTNPARGYTLVFGDVVTDNRNNYNKFTGIFTAPESGIYVFGWSIVARQIVFTQLVINGSAKSSTLTHGYRFFETVTGIAVVKVDEGDVVYVRTHPSHAVVGSVESYYDQHSSFMGWKIF